MTSRPHRFDAHPWEFDRQANESERQTQATFRETLGAELGLVAGTGGYLSPLAHIVGRGIRLGERNLVAAGVRLDGDLTTGANCSFNLNATSAGRVRLGDDVRVAACAGLWGFDHAHGDPGRPIASQGVTSRGITIGDDVWIGANATITDGVTIGSHVVIAAGAVVTRDLPDYALAAGNPARVIRDRRTGSRPVQERAEASLMALSEMAARDWRTILDHHRTGSRPGYCYSDPRNDASDPVRPDCDAIQIATMFGGQAGGSTRDEWVTALRERQDAASGLFFKDRGDPAPDPDADVPPGVHLYDILCVPYALECLGAAPAHRVVWADRVLARVGPWLEALPWETQGWHSGAMVDTLGTAAYLNARYFGGQPDLERLIGALAMRMDPTSGMWSPPAGHDWLQPVNGYYRLTRGAYAQFGLPLPWPERTIDTVLAHARRNDYFETEGQTACNVLDVIHPLMIAGAQCSHREPEIDAVIARLMTGIEKRWQEGRGFAFSPDEEPSLQGTEMWLSVAALAARHFGMGDRMSFSLCGIHRYEPAFTISGC